MTSLSAVRDAVKARLDGQAIAGLNVNDTWPNEIYFPSGGGCACIVNVVGVQYGQVFGASDRSVVNIELHLFVVLAGGMPNAQDNLDPYISNTGAQSVLQAFRADPYLGSTVYYCLPPSEVRDYGVKEIGPPGREVWLLGAIIPLEIHVGA